MDTEIAKIKLKGFLNNTKSRLSLFSYELKNKFRLYTLKDEIIRNEFTPETKKVNEIVKQMPPQFTKITPEKLSPLGLNKEEIISFQTLLHNMKNGSLKLEIAQQESEIIRNYYSTKSLKDVYGKHEFLDIIFYPNTYFFLFKLGWIHFTNPNLELLAFPDKKPKSIQDIPWKSPLSLNVYDHPERILFHGYDPNNQSQASVQYQFVDQIHIKLDSTTQKTYFLYGHNLFDYKKYNEALKLGVNETNK